MAVSARFIADFQSFDAAVQKAEIGLRSFESGASKVSGTLNRMSDSFSGRKVIQDATLMAEVFKRAGGAATFTTAELQRMGTVGAEAMEKITRTGGQVTPQLKAMAEATKGVGQRTSLLTTGIGALAGAFTLAKVGSFVVDLASAAGALQDMHERTDIGVAALQRFKVIAEQSGSSLDAVATAVFQMGRRLAGNDKSAASAVAELGLNFAQLRAQRPEDAFTTVGTALAALDDPMKRAQLGAAIFGRSVDDLIPTLKHLNDETGSYVTLTAQQVSMIDNLGDAWVRMKASLIPVTVAFIDNSFQLSRSYTFWSTLLGKIDEAPRIIGAAKVALDEMNASIAGRALQKVGGEELSKIQRDAIEQTNAALAAQAQALHKAEAAAVKLAATHTASAKALRAFHNEVGVQFIRDMEAANKATEDAAASMRQFNNEIGAQFIHDIESVNQATAETAAAMRALNNELGVLDMEREAREWAFVGPVQDDLIRKTETFREGLDELAGSLTQLAQVSGESFGGIVKVISQVVVSGNAAVKAFESIAAAASSAASSMSTTASTVSSLASGYVGLVTVGIALGESLVGLSAKERQANQELYAFYRTVLSTITATQELEAGTRGLFGPIGAGLSGLRDNAEATRIVVRDLYETLGLSAEQAGKDVDAALRGSPSARQAILDNIRLQQDLIDSIHDMGFQTQAELQHLADHAKGVFEFMERSGTYSAEQLAMAWERMAEATRRAMGDGSQLAADQAKAAGFKTREELENVADAARKTFEYMRDSGLYTAAEIARAMEAMNAATADAFGDAAAAVSDLQAEFDGLSASVADEAPERIMGSVERAARAEMATLKKQMDAQAKHIEDDAKAAVLAFEKALASLDPPPVRVPIEWDIPKMPRWSVEQPEGPQTSVTFPTTNGSMRGSQGGGTVVLNVEGRTLARLTVPHIPGVVREYGL